MRFYFLALCDNCLPVQCRLGRPCSGHIFLLQGENAARFCPIQGANAVRFFDWLLCRFLPLVFQSSTFLSPRFVGVVASEFFFRLRVVYCFDSARFFMGNPIGFASRKIFLEVPSVLPLFFRSSSAKIFGSELRDQFSGANFGILLAFFFCCAIACQYSVGAWVFVGVGLGFRCLLLALPSSFLGPAWAFLLCASPFPNSGLSVRTSATTTWRAPIAPLPLSFSPSILPGSAPAPALAPSASLSLSLLHQST